MKDIVLYRMDDERENVKRIRGCEDVTWRIEELWDFPELQLPSLIDDYGYGDRLNSQENRKVKAAVGTGASYTMSEPDFTGLNRKMLIRDLNLLEAFSRPLLGLKLTNPATIMVRSPDQDCGATNHGRQPSCEPTAPKLKASNFPVSLITIGNWWRDDSHASELTAKIYFSQKKLVWEILDYGGGLKNKMEMHWSDITAIFARFDPNQSGYLAIELGKQPLFFREKKPQAKKHTSWTETCDFTGGEALKHRRHYAKFPPQALEESHAKLMQCDPRLFELSQKPFPTEESSAYFNTLSPFNELQMTTSFAGEQTLQQPLNYPTSSVASPLQTAPNPIMPEVNSQYMDAWRDQMLHASVFDSSTGEQLSSFPRHNNYRQSFESNGAINVNPMYSQNMQKSILNPSPMIPNNHVDPLLNQSLQQNWNSSHMIPNSYANHSGINDNGVIGDQVLNHNLQQIQNSNPNPMSPNCSAAYANHPGIYNNGHSIDHVFNQNLRQIQNSSLPIPKSYANGSGIHDNGHSVDQFFNQQIQNSSLTIPNNCANGAGIHNNGHSVDPLFNQSLQKTQNHSNMSNNSYAAYIGDSYQLLNQIQSPTINHSGIRVDGDRVDEAMVMKADDGEDWLAPHITGVMQSESEPESELDNYSILQEDFWISIDAR